jgi:hypothetical protein
VDVGECGAPLVLRETGISEAQARDLIGLIGYDRNSLLREARNFSRNRLR